MFEDKTSFGFAEEICCTRFDWEILIGIRCPTHPEFIIPRYAITDSIVLSNSKLIMEFCGNLFRNDEKLITFWLSSW